MRVLLDECVPRGIRRHLAGHVVRSVQTLGWSGLSDAQLLVEADGRFDVIVTTDVRFGVDHDLGMRSFCVLVLRGPRSSLTGLASAAACLPAAMADVRPGRTVELGGGSTA